MVDKETGQIINILTNMAKRKDLDTEDINDIRKLTKLLPAVIDRHNPELVKMRSLINYINKLSSDVSKDEELDSYSSWADFDNAYSMKFNYLNDKLYECVDPSIIDNFSNRINSIFSTQGFESKSLGLIFNALYDLGDILNDVYSIKSVSDDGSNDSGRKRSR